MSTPTGRNENPRTTRVRQVIVDAAIDLLLTGGASEVTAAQVAKETGVARTTIYRQWPDQASLLLATIDALVAPHSPPQTSGQLDIDLLAALTGLRTRLTTRQVRPVFAALVDHASRDKAFVAAQRRFIEGMIRPTFDVLNDAQQRGDLPVGLNCSVAATMVTGPLFHQYLVMQEAVEDELIDEIASQFIGTYTHRYNAHGRPQNADQLR